MVDSHRRHERFIAGDTGFVVIDRPGRRRAAAVGPSRTRSRHRLRRASREGAWRREIDGGARRRHLELAANPASASSLADPKHARVLRRPLKRALGITDEINVGSGGPHDRPRVGGRRETYTLQGRPHQVIWDMRPRGHTAARGRPLTDPGKTARRRSPRALPTARHRRLERPAPRLRDRHAGPFVPQQDESED